MKRELLLQSISNDLKRRIVDCISIALEDDLQRYLSDFRPATTNGVPHQISDFINTNIQKYITSDNVEVIEFTRSGWRGKIIVDRDSRVTYTIMREKRLRQLQREKRERPHYLETIVTILNANFIAPRKQIPLFGNDYSRFNDEVIDSDYYSIFKGQVNQSEGYHHCVILYDTSKGELTEASVSILDRDLDEVSRISLNEFIKPDYSKLTASRLDDYQDESAEETSSAELLTLRRRKVETEATPIEIHKKKKSELER